MSATMVQIYVALAEVLDAVMVTCDAGLSRSPGLDARIELMRA